MPDLSDKLRSDSALVNRGKGYLLIWFLVAASVAAVIEVYFLSVHDDSTVKQWHNLRDEFGSRGPIVGVLQFLFTQGVGTAFFGSVSVGLSLVIVRICSQWRAMRWAALGILIANVLWSGYIVLFGLGDGHGPLRMPEEGLEAIAPYVAATMVVAIVVVIREPRRKEILEETTDEHDGHSRSHREL